MEQTTLSFDDLRKGLRIRHNFGEVRAALVEPGLSSRRVLRQALATIGVPSPREFDAPSPRPADLLADASDVLFIDVSEDDFAPLRLVAGIRARKAASNPFLPIVVTTFQMTPRLMRLTADAGADALLTKPVSYKMVAERLEALIEARAPFIVTASYIGPDRRKGARGGGHAIAAVVVPNTLAMRVLGQSMTDIDTKIEETWAILQRQRAQRCAFQIAFILHLAWSTDAVATVNRLHLQELTKIPAVLGDLLSHLPESGELTEAVTPLTGTLLEISRTLCAGDVTPEHITKAEGCAYQVMALVDPSQSLDRHIAMVQASVVAFRKRTSEDQC